jgi:D-glycero-D-manno-heptose 1,7-bisphosphate phosphatase
MRQCAILVGGRGTRLGSLTSNTPKPLLDCGGRPFLAWVLRELSRHGFEDFILLSGHLAEQVDQAIPALKGLVPKPISVRVSREPEEAGTGGALWHARHLLDEQFLLVNGDSWFDTNVSRFVAAPKSDGVGHVLLRKVPDASRYGVVSLQDDHISEFKERGRSGESGIINAGVYALSREAIDTVLPRCSLERDVLPKLAARGSLTGMVMNGYFIDIGTPDDFATATVDIPHRLRRPAVFFDRDGVLNEDHGWVGSRDRFVWMSGAKEAVQLANDLGYHAFVVTNQAGVARGLYTEQDVQDLHVWMTDDVRRSGATLDDLRYCPYHPDGSVAKYSRVSDWRKPEPGMILDLMGKWDVDRRRSILIGDKPSDTEAASRAGISGHLFTGGDLRSCLERTLREASSLR